MLKRRREKEGETSPRTEQRLKPGCAASLERLLSNRLGGMSRAETEGKKAPRPGHSRTCGDPLRRGAPSPDSEDHRRGDGGELPPLWPRSQREAAPAEAQPAWHAAATPRALDRAQAWPAREAWRRRPCRGIAAVAASQSGGENRARLPSCPHLPPFSACLSTPKLPFTLLFPVRPSAPSSGATCSSPSTVWRLGRCLRYNRASLNNSFLSRSESRPLGAL